MYSGNGIKRFGLLACVLFYLTLISEARILHIPFLSDTLQVELVNPCQVPFDSTPTDAGISNFYQSLNHLPYSPIIEQLLKYQAKHQLDDWLFYQLIRRTAQELSPKSVNYYRYTLYKWFLLNKCGYQATLTLNEDQLLFYVYSRDNIYGIPYYERDGKTFICLNIHDYDSVRPLGAHLIEISTHIPEGINPFSYRIHIMPDFKPKDYTTKQLQFNYQDKVYEFQVKINPQIKNLFTNYPVADFETYFNIPLSHETYQSLIPALKHELKGLPQTQAVDFLMQFTRYGFLYASDQNNFGKEKRLSPEQTLLYEHSDCDDRAALFFYLVKELYNLPMIVLLYPTHVAIAVQFEKPVGNPIIYKGNAYSICDPTPQADNPVLGEISMHLRHQSYEIVYAYHPNDE